MSIPADRKYTKDHEWLKVDGEVARVGITSHAAEALGDVVYVDLPEVGSQVTAGEPCGEIESTKSVSDLYCPLDGEVVSVNDALDDTPELVNSDPYGDGWLFELKVADAAAVEELLDDAAYEETLG